MPEKPRFIEGVWWRMCDRTGFKIRSTRTSEEWTGRIVRNESYEMRPAQDFVRGVRDDQRVEDGRPRQVDVFQGPLCAALAANAVAGATSLTVDTSARMTALDRIRVMLDDGATAIMTITSVPTTSSIVVSPPLPYKAASGNQITDVTAVTPANIG